MSAHYPRTAVPAWVATFERSGAVPLSHFNLILESIKRDSNPGYPWGILYRDKERVMLMESEGLYELVNERLKEYLSMDLSNVDDCAKALHLVSINCADPIRLFVKNEPHTIEKIQQGRFRLISSVSIVDEIIERLLCGAQNEAEIDQWLTCPSKPGLGLSKDEQTNELFESVRQDLDLGDGKKSDVSGWDFNFKGWLFILDYKRRVRLAQDSPFKGTWSRLLAARFVCLKWSVFITSDGVVFTQTKPGIMKSGSYLTSSTNSAARVGLAFMLGARKAMAMGDDCLEFNPASLDSLKEEYRRYGFRVKDMERCLDSFEFCSTEFRNGSAIPLNFWKGTYRLVSKPPSALELYQYLQEYRHVPELGTVVQFLSDLSGWDKIIN